MPDKEKLPEGVTRYADGQYGVDYRDATGRRIRKKIGPRKSEAKHYYDAMVQLRRVGDVLPRKQRAADKARLAEHLTAYADGSRNPTDRLYAGKWAEMIGKLAPEQLTVEMLRKWVRKMRQEGRAESTIHRWLSPLRTVYGRLVERRELPPQSNPFLFPRELGLEKIQNDRVFQLLPEQEKRLWEGFGPRWWPYVVFSILTGIRFGNLARARWEDIQWEARCLRLPKTKNGHSHVIHLSDQALDVLREMRERRQGDCPWVFPSPRGRQLTRHNWRRTWSRVAEQAGVSGYTHHGLRHTMASKLAQAGRSLPEIMQALGVLSPRMVRRYAHWTEQHMRSVMSQVRVEVTDWQMARETERTFCGHPAEVVAEENPIAKDS